MRTLTLFLCFLAPAPFAWKKPKRSEVHGTYIMVYCGQKYRAHFNRDGSYAYSGAYVGTWRLEGNNLHVQEVSTLHLPAPKH